MLNSYKIALKHLNFNLHDDANFQSETGRNSSIEITYDTNSNVSGLNIYDVYNFDDRMDITPHLYNAGGPEDKYLNYWSIGPVNLDINDTYTFIGHKNIQRHKESIIKAMMVALLTNNGKRSTTLSSESLSTKKEIFFNCLRHSGYRNNNALPWSTWRDTHTTLTNSGITATKTNGVVTVNTNTPHGLDAQYDDWGIVIETGNSNFDMPAATYPNGVPIKIVNSNSFTYRKSGSNTPTTSISGTFDVKIGWGGASNNLHLYFT